MMFPVEDRQRRTLEATLADDEGPNTLEKNSDRASGADLSSSMSQAAN